MTPGSMKIGPNPRVEKREIGTAGDEGRGQGTLADEVAEEGGGREEGGRGGNDVSSIGTLEDMCGEQCVGVGVVVDTGRDEVCCVGTVALPSLRAFQST